VEVTELPSLSVAIQPKYRSPARPLTMLSWLITASTVPSKPSRLSKPMPCGSVAFAVVVKWLPPTSACIRA
jgi:hypothetical protein